MLASNPTVADTTAPPGTYRVGDFVGTSTVWSAGTEADTAAPDRDYGNGNLATALASGNAGSGIAAATGSGSQGLDYDSVFFPVANRAMGWAGTRNWMKLSHACCRGGRQRRWAPITRWSRHASQRNTSGRETANDPGGGVSRPDQ